MNAIIPLLIVDDSSGDRYALRRALRDMDAQYELVEADSAEEGLEKVKRGHFSVVLVDHHLPRNDGLWLVRALRELPGGGPAVVMITGSGLTRSSQKSLAAGVDDYLLKEAVTSLGLHQAIINAIHKRDLRRQIDRNSARQSALVSLTASLSAVSDVPSILERIADGVGRALGASSCHLLLLDAKRERLRPYPAPGSDLGAADPSLVSAAQILASRVVERQELVMVSHPEELADVLPELVQLVPYARAAGALPLFETDRVLHSVVALVFEREFQDDHEFVRLVGDICSDAVCRASLVDTLVQRIAFEEKLLGVVSHDLRTPLNVIALSTELLREANASTAVLARIDRAVGRMRIMIKELLDLTSVRTSNSMLATMHPVRLDTLIAAVVEECRHARPDGATVEFVAESSLSVLGDPERLHQVLDNLLTNAYKHGADDRPVQISLARASDQALVTVMNHGEPIAPDLLEHLFEPFAKGQRGDGLGLGLYIARLIIDAHGGTITATSSRSEGTRLCIQLPLLDDTADLPGSSSVHPRAHRIASTR